LNLGNIDQDCYFYHGKCVALFDVLSSCRLLVSDIELKWYICKHYFDCDVYDDLHQQIGYDVRLENPNATDALERIGQFIWSYATHWIIMSVKSIHCNESKVYSNYLLIAN
jgi:hypothetical protein